MSKDDLFNRFELSSKNIVGNLWVKKILKLLLVKLWNKNMEVATKT